MSKKIKSKLRVGTIIEFYDDRFGRIETGKIETVDSSKGCIFLYRINDYWIGYEDVVKVILFNKRKLL